MGELEKQMASPGFWDDQEAAAPIITELKALKAVVSPVNELIGGIEDLQVLFELADEADSDEDLRDAATQEQTLCGELDRLELRTLLSGPHDKGSCYFSIHAGAGGTESCDWAEMLMRMYLRYFERNGYKFQEIDRTDGEEAGIRSITLKVDGAYAYGYLSCERGVHRLVRISPFDSQNRRHTSFASTNVLPELGDIDVDIDYEKDVREDTYRASGAGGQHVNKVESAIRITHIPTGLVVTCQDEKSQHKNKAKALKILRSRLLAQYQAEKDAKIAAQRKSMVSTGDRSAKIRTYNFPQGRVTDHRINLTLYKLEQIMEGDLDELIEAVTVAHNMDLLKASAEEQ